MKNDSITFEALGLTVLENLVSPQLLDSINSQIDSVRQDWRKPHGGGETQTAMCFGALLRENDAFRIAEAGACETARRWVESTLERTPHENVKHVIRCVSRDIPAQSYLRHFDSHALTLLIPLRLADNGDRNGDLLMYRQRRQSISLFGNLIIKAWLFIEQNLPFTLRRALIQRDLRRNRCIRISCEPGKVYVFNGLATLHANLDVMAGERRSLIIHYYDPGLTAGIQVAANRWRSMRDRIRTVR
jgi:hypothetical protein